MDSLVIPLPAIIHADDEFDPEMEPEADMEPLADGDLSDPIDGAELLGDAPETLFADQPDADIDADADADADGELFDDDVRGLVIAGAAPDATADEMKEGGEAQDEPLDLKWRPEDEQRVAKCSQSESPSCSPSPPFPTTANALRRARRSPNRRRKQTHPLAAGAHMGDGALSPENGSAASGLEQTIASVLADGGVPGDGDELKEARGKLEAVGAGGSVLAGLALVGPKQRTDLNLAEKVALIEAYERGGISQRKLARAYNVSVGCVNGILKQRERIKEKLRLEGECGALVSGASERKRARLAAAEALAPAESPELEALLVEWARATVDRGDMLTVKAIRDKALELWSARGLEARTLVPSAHWVHALLVRHALELPDGEHQALESELRRSARALPAAGADGSPASRQSHAGRQLPTQVFVPATRSPPAVSVGVALDCTDGLLSASHTPSESPGAGAVAPELASVRVAAAPSQTASALAATLAVAFPSMASAAMPIASAPIAATAPPLLRLPLRVQLQPQPAATQNLLAEQLVSTSLAMGLLGLSSQPAAAAASVNSNNAAAAVNLLASAAGLPLFAAANPSNTALVQQTQLQPAVAVPSAASVGIQNLQGALNALQALSTILSLGASASASASAGQTFGTTASGGVSPQALEIALNGLSNGNGALRPDGEELEEQSVGEQAHAGRVERSLSSSPSSPDQSRAAVILLTGLFLAVHPAGATVDYIWSYLRSQHPRLASASQPPQPLRASDVQAVLEAYEPALFEQRLVNAGTACVERRWFLGGNLLGAGIGSSASAAAAAATAASQPPLATVRHGTPSARRAHAHAHHSAVH